MGEPSIPRQYQYNAFISYRHNPRDQQIARRLLKLLETMRLKDGTKLHIFRDQEEFPTSSDLGNNIHKALEESEFLILICTPELLESKWCREELLYFRKLHNNTNRNILPLLVSGEPRDSFPPELFTDRVEERLPDGTVWQEAREVEPLGADVRADTVKHSLKKLKETEYLRLAAALLNCRFDDLYRREQRRLRRRIVTIALGIIAAASVMIAFLLWQLLQVKQAQLHEQLTYAQQLFDTGDRLRAKHSTQSVLEDYHWPMRPNIQEDAKELEFLSDLSPQFSVVTKLSPYLPDVKMAFCSDGTSLLKQDQTRLDRYSLQGALQSSFALEDRGQKICAVSPDGTRAAILRLRSDGIRVMDMWDTESQTLVAELLECSSPGTSDGLQANFSPDGSVLSVCRMGGYSNSNEKLFLYNAYDGRVLCELDGALLGTLQEDGVQDRIVEEFSFLNSDIAHWTGGAYEVYYTISEDSVRRVPRIWARRFAQTFPDRQLLLGCYALLTDGSEVKAIDLSRVTDESLFERMLELSPDMILPAEMADETRAVFWEMSEPSSGVFGGQKTSVLSRLWLCDLVDSGNEIRLEDLETCRMTAPAVYSRKGSEVVYLCGPVSGSPEETCFIRIDFSSKSVTYVTWDQPLDKQERIFLGSIRDQDYFAGSVGGQTMLFSIRADGAIRSRAVSFSMQRLRDSFDLADTQWGAAMTGEYQQNFCLISLESRAQRLDSVESICQNQFAVSADGGKWIRYDRTEITDAYTYELTGKTLDGPILYAGVGSNGAVFLGNRDELMLWSVDGSLQVSVSPKGGEVIQCVKLSENGTSLVWLTSPMILGNAAKHAAATIHSYDLLTSVETCYSPSVLWSGALPAENLFDCSSDGTEIVFLSDAVVPEVRILKINVPTLSRRQDIFPFEELGIATNETLTGVRFAGHEYILCTAGSSVALLAADSLEILYGIQEQSAPKQMPQLLPDGTLAYFGTNVDFWDVSSGRLLHSISGVAELPICWSGDGKWFIITNEAGSTLYNTQTCTPKELLSSDQLRLYTFTETTIVYADGSHIYRLAL